MTQEELDKIVQQHQYWIHKDVDGWEEMRANLYGVKLEGFKKEVTNAVDKSNA